MGAERVAYDEVFFQGGERFIEACGERGDIFLRDIIMGKMVDIFFHGWRGTKAVRNAVKPCGEHDGKGEVRIAGRVGRAQFHAGGGLSPGTCARHPDPGGAVDLRPANVNRRFISGHQAFVGIDGGREDCRERAGVPYLPGDE